MKLNFFGTFEVAKLIFLACHLKLCIFATRNLWGELFVAWGMPKSPTGNPGVGPGKKDLSQKSVTMASARSEVDEEEEE